MRLVYLCVCVCNEWSYSPISRPFYFAALDVLHHQHVEGRSGDFCMVFVCQWSVIRLEVTWMEHNIQPNCCTCQSLYFESFSQKGIKVEAP